MATKVYVATETAIVFKASGGDVTFTPQNVASGAGRVSAQWDRGSGSKPGRYKWYAKTKAGSALTAGNRLEIYFAYALDTDATQVDGNVGQSDAALATSDKRRNLMPVGYVEADSTTNGEVQVASGEVWITSRYVSVVWYNNFGQTLTNTAADHVFTLVPKPDESQ